MNKNEFLTWLKAQRDFYAKQPVILESEWLTFAQELQRNIYDTFRVTGCEITMRYSEICHHRVIDIAVFQYDKPGDTDTDKVLYQCLTLKGEFDVLRQGFKIQRTLLNKFIDYLIKNL